MYSYIESVQEKQTSSKHEEKENPSRASPSGIQKNQEINRYSARGFTDTSHRYRVVIRRDRI